MLVAAAGGSGRGSERQAEDEQQQRHDAAAGCRGTPAGSSDGTREVTSGHTASRCEGDVGAGPDRAPTREG